MRTGGAPISDRSRNRDAEAALSRLDELEEIYRSAPVGLSLVDAELRFVRINERFAAMNGRSVAEHVGRTVEEVAPHLAEQILPRYRKVFETGERIENVTVSDPTSGRTWLVSDHPLRRNGGRVTGIVTVVADVTELVRSDREVRLARERLRRAERVASLGCWEWDIPADTVWWSDECYRIFGRDPETFDPSFDAFFEHIRSEDRHLVRTQLDSLWAGSSHVEVEFRVVAGDGSERLVRDIGTLLRDENDEPKLLFGTVQDITSHQAERSTWEGERDALRDEIRQLEGLVKERTGALDQALDRLRRKRGPRGR